MAISEATESGTVVEQDRRRVNVWDLLMALLWCPFMAAGLLPEASFYALRDLAGVSPRYALVNSSFIITLAFAAYYAFFAFRRCREAGLGIRQSEHRAIQLGVLAVFAFIPYPLELFFQAEEIPMVGLRRLVYVIGATKVLVWLYLCALFARYHALGDRKAFWGFFRAGSTSAIPGEAPEALGAADNTMARDGAGNPGEAPMRDRQQEGPKSFL